MNFWIPIWRDLAQTQINGYLYSCSNCSGTIMIKTYTDKCPGCKELMELETMPQWLKDKKDTVR